MPAPNPAAEFANYCCDLLASAGPCTARRMFGGYGISTGGLNLAIIAWDTLYLKGNAQTAPQWLAAGSQVFAYEMRGQLKQMGYYSAPPEAMDGQSAMRPWAQLALQAALAARGAVSKPKRAVAGVKSAQLATKKVAKPRLVAARSRPRKI